MTLGTTTADREAEAPPPTEIPNSVHPKVWRAVAAFAGWDMQRPILTHAFAADFEHPLGLHPAKRWLVATDSYALIAVPMPRVLDGMLSDRVMLARSELVKMGKTKVSDKTLIVAPTHLAADPPKVAEFMAREHTTGESCVMSWWNGAEARIDIDTADAGIGRGFAVHSRKWEMQECSEGWVRQSFNPVYLETTARHIGGRLRLHQRTKGAGVTETSPHLHPVVITGEDMSIEELHHQSGAFALVMPVKTPERES